MDTQLSERQSRRLINQLAQLEATRRYQEARCSLAVEFHAAELHGRSGELLESWMRRLDAHQVQAPAHRQLNDGVDQ